MRVIPHSDFGNDDGATDPDVTRTLSAYAAGEASYAEALLTLQSSRLLVPVVAVLGELEYDEQGLAHDKTSDMAAVLVRGADGRRALLAFTGNEPMKAWNPDARPVPVPVRLAAQAAVRDEASAVVVDLAGPVTLVIQGDDLRGLAAGHRLVRMGEQWGWIVPGQDD